MRITTYDESDEGGTHRWVPVCRTDVPLHRIPNEITSRMHMIRIDVGERRSLFVQLSPDGSRIAALHELEI